MRTKYLLSLFDYTGSWSEPYYQDPHWQVIQWDIKIDEFMDIRKIDLAETALELFPDVDGILAAVPCTDFTNSGAQYWEAKDQKGVTKKSQELIYQVERLAELYNPTDPDYELENGKFFWSIENPVGRLPKLHPELGEPFYFNPYEYAGHLNIHPKKLQILDRIREKNGVGVTTEEAEIILTCNAYTKKTCLFGKFDRNLEKKIIESVRACPQGSPMQRFGGKSEKTKEIRSITPAGFAKAFYQKNKGDL